MSGENKKPAYKLSAYKRQLDYSYAFGAFTVYELLEAKAGQAVAVHIHSSYADKAGIESLCRRHGVPVVHNDRSFNVAGKENCYVFAVFRKYTESLEPCAPHVALVEPGDMGNLGTVIRTMAAFGLCNLALIGRSADVFHPKAVRASMGALFRINTERFLGFEDYRRRFGGHDVFPFMLDGAADLSYEHCPVLTLFTLVFGNEASGLPVCFAGYGRSFRIPQTRLADSLNLSVAAGIGIHIFASKNGLIK